MAVRELRIDEDVTQVGVVRELLQDEEVLAIEPEIPGIGAKIVNRFRGTDVDDPFELTRVGALVAGAIIGGKVGTRVPRAPGVLGIAVNPLTGALFFGLAGTIAGAVAPEATLTIGEAIGLLPAGTRTKLGLSPEDLRTVIQGEALMELATFGGISVLRFTGRRTAKLFTGLSTETAATADRAAARGIALLPVQIGDGQIARGYVVVIGRFPWIGSPIRKAAQKAEIDTIQSLHETASRIGPISAWSDISQSIFKDAKELLKKTNDMFSKQYEDIFRRADELEVSVLPEATLDKANEILRKILEATPVTATGKRSSPGPALKKVVKFIKKQILPLTKTEEPSVILRPAGDVAAESTTTTAAQSLRQMDGLLTKIDQEIAALKPGQKRFANSLLVQLRQSVQLDMFGNMRGTSADIIRAELKATDEAFSYTMAQLFETAGANKFAIVQQRGIRAVGFEKATRTPIDQLARTVVKLESPQAIDELSRLVSTDTMRRIAATTIDDAIIAARSGKGAQFNADKFARRLGLDDLNSPKAKSLAKMLEASNNPLTVKELADFTEAARVISNLDIPNVSTFIARRATIGGIRALLTGLIPGLALTGVVAWGAGTLIAGLTFVGGTRLISAIISNPASARSLKQVLDVEATTVVRRAAVLRAMRLGVASLRDEDQITEHQRANMETAIQMFMLEMNEQLKQLTETEGE